MAKKIIISIDGFSSCGKSTLAKDLAKKLKYRYIDTGAMYRAVTYYFLKHNISLEDDSAVEQALNNIHIDFEYDKDSGKQIVILNGENVEKEIRKPDVSNNVSPVSAIKKVRQFLVTQQQKMGSRKGIVMDGRDIGTVVFPKAELKIFLTAEEDIRVERRWLEMKNANIEIDFEEVRDNLKSRDHMDSHRVESPLRKAEDAIILDNTHLSIEEQADWVLDHFIGILVA
jgi:cytidylate kinase